jgi:hypothetical protein
MGLVALDRGQSVVFWVRFSEFLYQLFCVENTIQVRSSGKDKNRQVVGSLP